MNEIVTLIIHIAQKSKHEIKMFALQPFPFFLKHEMKFLWSLGTCNVGCRQL